jgi:DNA-binding SARP family transcriptional activator
MSVSCGNKRFEDKLSHKSLAILSLLVSSPDMRIRKSRLTALLWPDSDPFAAKSNLRFNLWSIRKIICDGHEKEFITADREYVWIDPEYPVASDILAVKHFDSGSDGDIDDLNILRQAFRGEFMEGFYLSDCDEYADMILMERMSCQNIRIDILETIYDRYLHAKDVRGAIRAMGESLIIDPFNETFAARVIRHRIALGELTQAIDFYRNFAVRLRKNLNVAPSAELQELYAQIRKTRSEKSDGANSGDTNSAGDNSGGVAYGGENAGGVACGGESYGGENAAARAEAGSADAQTFIIVCIPGIDYYWMTECIDQIAGELSDGEAAAIPRRVTMDLSYIYPRFGESDEPSARSLPEAVPNIRLIYALREYIERVVSPNGIHIITRSPDLIDGPSAAFLKFMECKPINGVRFTMEG